MSAGFRPSFGGAAVVVCAHDREKRQVRDAERVAFVGRAAGVRYDARRHRLHLCACCENLFVTDDDTPTFCSVCQSPAVHPLAAALPLPTGVVDG